MARIMQFVDIGSRLTKSLTKSINQPRAKQTGGQLFDRPGQLLPYFWCRYYSIKGKSHYETLGVPPNASKKQIKAAFLDLSKKYHPDINKSVQATQNMAEISAAYDVLSKSESKNKYDMDRAYSTQSQTSYQTKTGSSPGQSNAYDEYIRRRQMEQDFHEQFTQYRKSQQKQQKQSTFHYSSENIKRAHKRNMNNNQYTNPEEWFSSHMVKDKRGRWRDKRFYKETESETNNEEDKKNQNWNSFKKEPKSLIRLAKIGVVMYIVSYPVLVILMYIASKIFK